MEIPVLPECNTVLVFGPVSSGKSTLVQQWILGLPRSVTIDITAECMDNSYEHIWGSPKEFLVRLRDNPFYYRIAYHPSSRAFNNDFKWVVEGVWLSVGRDDSGITKTLPRWVIVDECHEICSVNSVTDEMDLIIRYCRHNLVGFVGITHRFADVNRLLTQNCRMIVLFHTTEPPDCDAIKKRLGAEVEAQVRALRPLIVDEVTKEVYQHPQCLVWIRGKGTKIFDLGDKIQTGEHDLWVSSSKETQTMQPAQSLDSTSGKKELGLQEPTLETGNPQ